MQSGIVKHAGIAWSLAVLASTLVLVASVFGPRPAFVTLCHQLPSRSFVVEGHLFAVCQRCTGIYTGIFLGLLATLLPAVREFVSRYGLLMVGLSLGLVSIDFGIDFIGLVSNSPASRVVTGLVLGASGGAFLGVTILTTPVHTYRLRNPKSHMLNAKTQVPNAKSRTPRHVHDNS